MASFSGSLLPAQQPENYAQQPQHYAPQPQRSATIDFNSPNLRPVREVVRQRANAYSPTNTPPSDSAPRNRVNETLRWRKSPDVRPVPHHVPDHDPFDDADVQDNQFATESPSPIQQVGWSSEAKEILVEALNHHNAESTRQNGSLRNEADFVDAKQDFFGNPFGDATSAPASASINGAAVRHGAEQNGSNAAELAQEQAIASSRVRIGHVAQRLTNQVEMVSPTFANQANQAPSNALRGNLDNAMELPPPRKLQDPSSSIPSVQAPSVQAPPVQAPSVQAPSVQAPSVRAPAVQDPAISYDNLFGDETPPATAPSKSSPTPADPTQQLRDLMQSVNPNKLNDTKPTSPMDKLPNLKGDGQNSASDQNGLFDNPFPKRDPIDEEGLKALEDRIEAYRGNRPRQSGSDDDDLQSDPRMPSRQVEEISCDEFRKRISREKIRSLSLDISPPFRPDEFNVDEYKKLKAKFDEAQLDRDWTSLDGQTMANGRLNDLAYEKAIIITPEGNREALPLDELSEDDLAYIAKNWGLPKECKLEQVAYTPRNWEPHVMTWKASNLCHKPLYFEEVNLERYGHTAGPFLQPIVSSAHFFANISALPYKMGVHSPCECQYALGYYRPGNCAPWILPPVPISLRGAAAQAAATTTGFLLIP